MDKFSSSSDDDNTLSQGNTDKSVSELLSSYYKISDDLTNENEDDKISNDSKLKDYSFFTDKDFLSNSFDVDLYFDNVLKQNSISDTVALLRKLERETRQLTAGKQLLIYDNYECLFSALDTVYNINKELEQVQNHLKTLKSSQIKAASKDITSRYGIRDKFLYISHLSKVSEVFKFLANLCNSLSSFNTSNTLFCSNGDETANVLKYSSQDILYFCSRVYYVFKYFEKDHQFIFSTYYTFLSDLVSRNVSLLLFDKEPLSYEHLLESCRYLRELSFDNNQLVEFYFFDLSSLLENKMKNLFINYTNNDFSFTGLSNEVFDSLLSVVYSSVSNEKFNLFMGSLDQTKKTKRFNFYDSTDVKVEFQYGDSGLFTGFHFSSPNECSYLSDELPTQFVFYYTQASFFVVSYLLTSYKYTLETNDVSSGLFALLDKLNALRVETPTQKLFFDLTLKWLMAVCVLYVQYLFFKLYDSVISKTISLLNGSYNSDLCSYLLTSFEKLVKELKCLEEFAKEVSNPYKNNFKHLFNSLIVVYTCGFKYIYLLVFQNLNNALYNGGKEVNYLDSVLNLVSLRSCNDKSREHFVQDYLKQTLSRAHGLSDLTNGSLSSGSEYLELLSVVEFMDKCVKVQLQKFKFEVSNYKTYRKNLLSFLLRLDGLYNNFLGVLEKNFNESYKMFNSRQLTLKLNIKQMNQFEQLKSKLKEHVLQNTDHLNFNTMFDDLLLDEELPFLNLVVLSHEYNKTTKRYFPFQKDNNNNKNNNKENKNNNNKDKKNNKENKKEDNRDNKNNNSKENNNKKNNNKEKEKEEIDTSEHNKEETKDKKYKTHFERFDVGIGELANEVVSHMMFDYLDKSLKIIRYVLDNLEAGSDFVDDSVKDFTILLSEILQDVSLLTVSQAPPEVMSITKQLDRVLNTSLNSSDLSNLVNLYKFNFNTSRDMCLKLFTLHIVQALSQYKASYIVDENLLNKFYDGLKQQILIIFKKNLDLFIMQSVWEKILNVS